MTVYLIKDNDELVSHCECERAYMTYPPQMACPWCGCGWLFTCIDCRKAFTFARAVEVPETLNELAMRDIPGLGDDYPSTDDVDRWVTTMGELLTDVTVGEQYVYLDGSYIPTSASGIKFEGWHASHDLEFVPQVKALEDYSVSEDILSNEEYWQSNAVQDDGEP